MTRAALVVACLLLAPACSSSGAGQVPVGTYAGSTRSRAELVLSVGGEVTVNGKEARALPEGGWRVRDGGLELHCRPAPRADGVEQISCETRLGDVVETVELVRL